MSQPRQAFIAALLAAALFGAPSVLAENTPAAPSTEQAGAATANTEITGNKPQPQNVDVWQYLASPFGDSSTAAMPVPSVIANTRAPQWSEEYWNCLLINLRGIGSDLGARLIAKACQEKFPQK